MKLSQFCQKYLFDNKLFIVPNHGIGYQMIWDASKEHKSLLNLKTSTLKQLAEELTSDYRIVNDIRLIDANEGSNLIYILLHEHINDLSFFQKEQCNSELAEEIYNLIRELKLHEISLNNNSEKQKTLQKIVSLYNNYLETHRLWDQADMYELLCKITPVHNCKFALLSNLELTPLELKFLNKITNNEFHVINMPKPIGVDFPKAYLETPLYNESLYNNSIINLYSNKPIDKEQVEVFKGYGETNEVNYVFQHLFKQQIPFEDAVILYTDPHYGDLIKQTAEFYNIPIKFGSGLSIISTRAFHFIKEICLYIQNGFKVKDLKNLFLDGAIVLPYEKVNEEKYIPSTKKLYETVTKLKFGWGFEYIDQKLEDALNISKNNHVELKMLKAFFEDLKKETSNYSTNKEVDFHKFLTSLITLGNKYINDQKVSKTKIAIEKSGKKVIMEELNNLLCYPTVKLSLDETIARILNHVEKISFYQSTESPGHLHTEIIQRAGFLTRKHIYVIGLDSKRFPIRRTENPLLTDLEREELNPSLLQSKDYENNSKYKLLEALGTTNGKIAFGYSYFDTIKVRENNPSTFIQQLMGQANISVEEITDYGFIPNDPDMVTGKLAAYLHKINVADDNHLFQVRQPIGIDGVNTNEDEEGKKLSEQLTFSATGLATLHQCKLKFYFQNVLYVRKKEEVEFDLTRWLKANELGTLYHSIFERVFNLIVTQKNHDITNALIEQIIKEEFTKKKQEVPCPTDEIYFYELNRALDFCMNYILKSLKDMKENHWVPIATEQKFDRLEIKIGEKRILLKGAIDRVDQLANGKYRIVDYKTGKVKRFEDKHFHIQHYLYKLAYEALGDDIEVVEAVYEFPLEDTYKKYSGEELNYTDIEEEKDKVSRIVINDYLEQLLADVDNRNFLPDKGDHCDYCDYQGICRVDFSDEVN